jgi:hypothetical protein
MTIYVMFAFKDSDNTWAMWNYYWAIRIGDTKYNI